MSTIIPGKFVTFKSGKEHFGIRIEDINEIVKIQEVTRMPESEDYIKGVINLRGKMVPVIDIRIRFKQVPFEYTDKTCIIITSVKNITVGFIVEEIEEVIEFKKEDMVPKPVAGNVDKSQNSYIFAIGEINGDIKLLLDVDKLLNEEDVHLITNME